MTPEETAAGLEAALTTRQLGKPVRFYPFAVTTESLALGWARKEQAPEGATIVADQELSPRQRKGPVWIPFASQGLYFAMVLRPALPPEGESLLWLMTTLGAAEGLEAATGMKTSVKWPDDILVGGKKIGGIKVEAQLGPGEIASAVVTGRFNLNVPADAFPDSIKDIATSVLAETGKQMELSDALNAVMSGIERRYDDDVADLMKAYTAKCETIGKQVRATLLPKGEVAGTATGIDPFGCLVIDVGGRSVPVVIDTLRKLEPIQSQI